VDEARRPGRSVARDTEFPRGGGHEWLKVSGGFAIALAAFAMYGGTAFALEDARQEPVLPLFRRGAADRAFKGFEAQLDPLEAEPGVRQQL
jgi:hypothetical protein